ncbi:MAG: hypothetical protein JWR86_2946 [Enterovirga sp.]|nr:hypothetical protein [Enterovirga sp.]
MTGPSIGSLCPDRPPAEGPVGPLTIDTHVHMFNASDIQIRDYIAKVRSIDTPGLEHLADVLAVLGDALAPSGQHEAAVLRDVGGRLAAACGPGEAGRALSSMAEAQHQRSIGAVKAASARLRPRGLRSTRAHQVADAIAALPDRYATMTARRRKRRLLTRSYGAGSDAEAAAEFVAHQLQYRFVNLIDFLDGYQARSGRRIDLALCHMLDFDWPLSGGRPTPTSLEDQVDLMEQVAILTGGRVHGYAPFDPFRQVAFSLGMEPNNPLDRVVSAVTTRGCIGVKMYPPMGFAPYGNTFLDPKLWLGSSIPKALQRPDLGSLLDAALGQLYVWCAASGVPIMLHTSASNGPSVDFRTIPTDPSHWTSMPEPFSQNLRVSFGHFGDTDIGRINTGRAEKYAALMGKPGEPGANYYADAAYFTHGLDNPSTVKDALGKLYGLTAQRGDAALAQRLMYGSDWEMLLIEGGDTTGYLSNFVGIFRDLDKTRGLGAEGRLSERFFGLNAARYLGLHDKDTDSTRGRLDSFYVAKGVARPAWQVKVDRSVGLSS